MSLSLSLSLYIYIYICETYFIYLSCHNIKIYDIITRIMGPFYIWGLNAIVSFAYIVELSLGLGRRKR